MLYFFACVLFILGIKGQAPVELKCDFPPTIPNGEVQLLNYKLDREIMIYVMNESITKVYSYDFRVDCNPGFHITASFHSLSCEDGVMEDTNSCVSTCEKDAKNPTLLSCGMGYDNFESKCMIPSEGIVGFAGAASKCGRLPSGSAVVNGSPAKHGDVPWHVGIYSKKTRPYMQVCGGTLVRNNVVISAAHCFWSDIEKKLPAENFAVAAGKIYRPWNNVNDSDTATKSDVSEIRIPPRYRGGATNFQDDLAVLLLTTPLSINNVAVALACLDFDNILDEKQLQDRTIGTVAGWGLTSADGPASQFLNVVKLPMVDIEQCINEAEPSFLSSITSDKICAGYTNGTTVCRGDSGGGLTVPKEDSEGDQYFLRGIVSTAPKSDHLCNVYAVATFTHVAKHRHFINAVMSGIPEKSAVNPASPSGVIDQQSPGFIQLTDPLNANVNTDVNIGANTDANTDVNIGANTDVNIGANTDANTDVNIGTITGASTGVNTNLNINLSNRESDIPPANSNGGFNILPVTKSPNDDNREHFTVSYTERVFCAHYKELFIKKCYFTTPDLTADRNGTTIKCKNNSGVLLTDCEDD